MFRYITSTRALRTTIQNQRMELSIKARKVSDAWKAYDISHQRHATQSDVEYEDISRKTITKIDEDTKGYFRMACDPTRLGSKLHSGHISIDNGGNEYVGGTRDTKYRMPAISTYPWDPDKKIKYLKSGSMSMSKMVEYLDRHGLDHIIIVDESGRLIASINKELVGYLDAAQTEEYLFRYALKSKCPTGPMIHTSPIKDIQAYKIPSRPEHKTITSPPITIVAVHYSLLTDTFNRKFGLNLTVQQTENLLSNSIRAARMRSAQYVLMNGIDESKNPTVFTPENNCVTSVSDGLGIKLHQNYVSPQQLLLFILKAILTPEEIRLVWSDFDKLKGVDAPISAEFAIEHFLCQLLKRN